MFQHMRYAMRMLMKQPGFTVLAVLTLALGIGATAAVFSLIQGVLRTTPPYRQPDRIVLIRAAWANRQAGKPQQWPAAQWMDWQKKTKSFAGFAGYDWIFTFLILSDGSESMEGMWVTPEYFRVTGLRPVRGRTFLESDAGPKATPVIIVGYEFWQRKLNGDPHIIGRTMRISRRDAPSPVVIGVMPPGVRFLPSPTNSQEPNYNVNATVDFWLPAAPDPKHLKDRYWNVVGRLQTGATLQQAQSELIVIARQEANADHDFDGILPEVQSLMAVSNQEGSRILLPLMGAAGLVLLIACGNVAALLLVRGLQRQQEYAVRTALGISRVALFLQVSGENLLLALVGGVFGIGLAFGIVRLFKLIGGHAIPRLDAVTTGWPVLACGIASAILAAVVAGLIPAVRAARLDTMEVLKSAGPKSSAGRGERRLLRGVTMAQTALTLVLLTGAGLLIRTMINLSKVRSGYDVAHILTMTVTEVQWQRWSDFHVRALERVSAVPGVQNAAFAWGVPLTGNSWPATVEIEGQPAARSDRERIAMPLRSVTPGYFRLLGLSLAEGRDFRSSDKQKSPNVAVVNQALVTRYFPKADPVGKKLWLGGRQEAPTQIIGVVTNGRTDDLTQAAAPEIYLCLWQASAFSKDLVIRTAADPRAVILAVQRELRSIDPTVAIENVRTLEQIRGDSQASRTFAMQLLVGFSVVGSVLTLVGIYGALSLSVASRRREIAIRTAVGAEWRDIRNLVFSDGFRLVMAGVISGAAAALILSRVLRSFLFQVEPADPLTLISVGLVFTGVALLACWVPTRRAAKVNPVEVLRYE